VLPALVLAAALWCAPGGCSLEPRGIGLAAAQEAQDAKPAPQEKTTGDGAQTAPAASAKPSDKPKKVITNDDLKSSGSSYGGNFATPFGQINDCDSTCFDAVRSWTRASGTENQNWRRDELEAIDRVRGDPEWQRYLRDIYEAQRKVCQVTNDRRDELFKFANPRNVTPEEIAIDEKYDPKMKAAQAELEGLRTKLGAMQKKFFSNPYAYQFAIMQGMRTMTVNCPSTPRTIYY